MWDEPWNWIGKRFAPLRPLTKIYVGVAAIVIWFAAAFALSSLGQLVGASQRIILIPLGVITLGVVVAAAPIERFVLKLVAWYRPTDEPDQSQN